jgi:GT2 family glycosyltransferase
LKVACIFVTWNSEQFVDDSIGQAHRFVAPEDIIVVDNGSIDRTVELLNRNYPHITLHQLPLNTGFSGGNNYGMREALKSGYEAVMLLNVDTIIEEDFVTPCAQVLHDHPDVGVVGPVVLDADKDNVIQSEGGRIRLAISEFPYRNRGRTYKRRSGLTDVGYVLGAALMVRREVIERIGYLDEDYFPAYGEEADFCLRARKSGYRCVVNHGCAIRHIGEQSSGGRQKAFNRLSVHRFYFAIKHLGPNSFLLSALLIMARVFYWKCRSALFER